MGRRNFKVSGGVRRRCCLDIVADILAASRSKVKKTHLMYKCSMSFTQMKTYLDMIVGAKLLLVDNDGPSILFKISKKGINFLKSYNSLKALIE